MKVGTRITATTSALAAITLGAYTLFNVREVQDERRDQVVREARAIAAALRATIEAQGVRATLDHADEVERALAKSGTAWRVAILDAELAGAVAPPGREAQLDRLTKLIELRPSELTSEIGDTFIYAVPLRIPSGRSPDGFQVAGAIELSRSLADLARAQRADLWRTLGTLIVIVGLLTAAIALSTRRGVAGPIEKLIAGIDDVAQGDLSRVLLSERDDEIGALAARFNEMTFSLRESRAETQRQNEAKLALENRLFQTEKLATLGQLAAEIAHEVGTPLNVIAGRAAALAKKANDPEAVAKNAGIIAEQAGRITRIIQRLLDFTRRKVGSVEPQNVNLNGLTLTTMDFLEGQFASAKVKTSLSRAEGLPVVKGNPDQLQQVLINLFLNAIQAMPDGGTLRVDTSVVTRQRPGLEVAPAQRYVCIEIADSGVGIPLERRDKIFEPFYTSREQAGGTGLGLAVSHGIVKQHDGWIELDDAPGGGTVFRIFLPAADEKA